MARCLCRRCRCWPRCCRVLRARRAFVDAAALDSVFTGCQHAALRLCKCCRCWPRCSAVCSVYAAPLQTLRRWPRCSPCVSMLLCAFANAAVAGLGAAVCSVYAAPLQTLRRWTRCPAVCLRTLPRAFANARFRPFGGAALASFAHRGMGRAAVAHGLVLAADLLIQANRVPLRVRRREHRLERHAGNLRRAQFL